MKITNSQFYIVKIITCVVEFVHKGGEGTNMHTATMQSYCEDGDAIVCVGRPIMWSKSRKP